MNPHRINIHLEAYKIKREREIEQLDHMAWEICGNYVLPAVTVAVEHCLAGRKAKSKYVEKPFFLELEEKKKAENMTEEERIEGVKALFARLGSMQESFEKSKKTGQ